MDSFIFYDYVLPSLGLFLFYVFASPLLILATFRQRALPNIVPHDFDATLPSEVADYFYDCHEELTKLGFENVGTFSLPNQIENVKAVLVLFVNRQTKTSAMSVVMFAKVLDNWKLQTKFTEFSTAFSLESYISTMNSRQVGAFPQPDHCVKTQQPHIQNLSVLHAAHQAMVEFHFPASQRMQLLDEVFRGDAEQYIAAGMTAEFDDARKQGYLRLTGEGAVEFGEAFADNPYMITRDFEPPVYRPTIKGAYLITWKELWPFKPIFYRLRYARDRRLLANSGFQADQISPPA